MCPYLYRDFVALWPRAREDVARADLLLVCAVFWESRGVLLTKLVAWRRLRILEWVGGAKMARECKTRDRK